MFATLKFRLGITTIFIAHTTFNIPYVLFIVLSRLDEFDYSIVEAAYDLGATNKQTLTKVKPIKMIVEDDIKNNKIYILYNEVDIK